MIYESEIDPIESNYGGHFYQYIPGSFTWAAAYVNAQNVHTQLGKANSYLATITSAEENDYLHSVLKVSNAWMAAVNSNTPANITDEATKTAVSTAIGNRTGWFWVAGPEAGTQFMTAVNGGPITGQYNKWRANEPNNAGGEWAAVFSYGGAGDWNDFNGGRTYGYLVEYQAAENGAAGDVYANDVFVVTKTAPVPSRPATPTTPTPDAPPETGTTDEPTDPHTNGVSELLNVDEHVVYMAGYPDGEFRPGSNMTRAEAAQLFYNLLKNKDVSGDKYFSDVTEDKWYYKAVMTLANLGIVDGVDDPMYQPTRPITRAEFIAMAMRFASKVNGEKAFVDVTEENWAFDHINGAAYYGWVDGYEGGYFKPNASITRAEVTTVVNRMLNRRADEAFINANLSTLKTFPDVPATYWAYYSILEAANRHEFIKADDGTESWEK